MLLTIYDKAGTKRADVAVNDSSTQSKEVQGDNVLSLSFSYYDFLPLDVNDYTDYLGERYWLTERYTPKQVNEGEWDYDLKLYGVESLIKRFLVLETTDGDTNPLFTLTATPREHVAMVVKAINDGMGHTTDWKVGTVEGTELITIDYEGMYCNEALKAIAEKAGGKVEWWIEGQTVNVCRCEHGEEITLGYGKGLTSLERDTGNTAKFYTRLFPVGSTRNIDAEKYGSPRLMLPGGKKYIEQGVEEYGIYDHYEQDAFSGIYPHRVGTVSSVRSEEVTDEEGNKFTIYYFRDGELNFDPNLYELAGETKRVSFQTGDLAGLGESDDHYFEVNYDSAAREFELITIWPYDDDTQLPGGKLVPRAGDTYILWNIRMPDEYYRLAEEEFAVAVEEYNRDHWLDIAAYKAPTDPVYMEEHGIDLFVGRRVKLESRKYFPEKGYRQSRITKISRKVNEPGQMDIEISDALQVGKFDKVTDSIGALKSYTKSKTEGAALPDIIRSWDKMLPTDNNLFSARRSQKEFLSKNQPDTAKESIRFLKGVSFGEAAGGKPCGIVDGEGNAEYLTAVIRELLRSTEFVDGLTGEGWQLWIDQLTGLTNLTVDKVTARQSLVALELLIEQVRSVCGQLVVSAANGKIKDVVKQGDNYRIVFEQESGFVAHDLMRCAVTGGKKLKAYWVEVSSVIAGGVMVPVSEFGGVKPEAGDECVLMGNKVNPLRQNLISIAATEDGQPRIDILDGVKAKNFNGCLRCRLGKLDGIRSSAFPADNQPKGNGLYADNVWLKGTFVLMTGEDILTRFEITEGKIHSAVESLRKEIREEQSYLDNSSFADGMDKWKTGSKATLFTLGGRWIWANGGPYGTKPDGHAEIRTDGKVPYAYIRNNYIMQRLQDFRLVPEYRQTNSQGERVPGVVYLSFSYRVIKAGRLKIEFVNADKTGFENFNMFGHEEDLPVGGEKMFTLDGLWNGTGDFKLSFTGVIYISLLVLSTNRADALAYKYRTLFEQSDKLVKIAAENFDANGKVIESSSIITTAKYNVLMSKYFAEDGSLINCSGLVTNSNFAELFAKGVTEEGLVKTADIKAFVTKDDVGEIISGVTIRADQIQLEGLVTANNNFKILEDGSIEAQNGKFTGEIDATTGKIGGFSITYGHIGIDREGDRNGMFLYDTMIGFNGDDMQSIIGTWSNLGTYLLGRFINTRNDFVNYGLVFDVSGSMSDRNYAFVGNGDGILKGVVEGFKLNWISFAKDNEAIYINLNKGKYVEVNVNYKNCVLMLPLLSELRTALGLSSKSTDDIAVRLTVVKRSGTNVRVYGRTNQVTINGSSVDNDEHPYLRDNNFGNTQYWEIGNGDTVEFLLTFSGNEYNAYTVSIHR